jgi:hypothetical protein
VVLAALQIGQHRPLLERDGAAECSIIRTSAHGSWRRRPGR